MVAQNKEKAGNMDYCDTIVLESESLEVVQQQLGRFLEHPILTQLIPASSDMDGFLFPKIIKDLSSLGIVNREIELYRKQDSISLVLNDAELAHYFKQCYSCRVFESQITDSLSKPIYQMYKIDNHPAILEIRQKDYVLEGVTLTLFSNEKGANDYFEGQQKRVTHDYDQGLSEIRRLSAISIIDPSSLLTMPNWKVSSNVERRPKITAGN